MDQTILIIIVIVICVCVCCVSSSIGGGIFFTTQTAPITTTRRPTTTTSAPITTTSAPITTKSTSAPASGIPAAAPGTSAPSAGTSAPVAYNVWQCYLNSNKTRRDDYNDGEKNGFIRDQAFTQKDANDFCNSWVSDCSNKGGCTAYNYIAKKEPTNTWQCYLNSDKLTRGDTYNDGEKNGFVRDQAFTQKDANDFCNSWVTNCAGIGCTAYKRRP